MKNIAIGISVLAVLVLGYLWFRKQIDNATAAGIDAGQKSILGF